MFAFNSIFITNCSINVYVSKIQGYSFIPVTKTRNNFITDKALWFFFTLKKIATSIPAPSSQPLTFTFLVSFLLVLINQQTGLVAIIVIQIITVFVISSHNFLSNNLHGIMTTEKKTSLFQQTHIQTDSIPLQIHHILQYVFFYGRVLSSFVHNYKIF